MDASELREWVQQMRALGVAELATPDGLHVVLAPIPDASSPSDPPEPDEQPASNDPFDSRWLGVPSLLRRDHG